MMDDKYVDGLEQTLRRWSVEEVPLDTNNNNNNTNTTQENNVNNNSNINNVYPDPTDPKVLLESALADVDRLNRENAALRDMTEGYKKTITNQANIIWEAACMFRSFVESLVEDYGTDVVEDYSNIVSWFVNNCGMKPLTKQVTVDIHYTVCVRGTVEIPITEDASEFDSDSLELNVHLCGTLYDDYVNTLDVTVVDEDVQEWEVEG